MSDPSATAPTPATKAITRKETNKMNPAIPLRQRLPLTRAQGYPHSDDPAAPIVDLACSHIGVDHDVVAAGRVTLFADTGDPQDPYGFEFDLEPAAARRLGQWLLATVALGSEEDGR